MYVLYTCIDLGSRGARDRKKLIFFLAGGLVINRERFVVYIHN